MSTTRTHTGWVSSRTGVWARRIGDTDWAIIRTHGQWHIYWRTQEDPQAGSLWQELGTVDRFQFATEWVAAATSGNRR